MEFSEFETLAGKYRMIPVYEKITGDLLTPVSAFLKLRQNCNSCFLLESVEGIGRLARYSFIGKDPVKLITGTERKISIRQNGLTTETDINLFDFLKSAISETSHPVLDKLPYFTGGIVGYIGYENISLIEDVIKFDYDADSEFPDAILGDYRTIVAFDHFKHQVILICNVEIDRTDSESILSKKYEEAKSKIRGIKKTLSRGTAFYAGFRSEDILSDENEGQDFLSLVEKVKKNIHDGDVFQLVLSKRFGRNFSGDDFNIYRALRIINPSPYMYYMQFDNDIKIIGTSPEDLLKVKNRKAEILPIAGTRKRGSRESEDKRLEEELINDPKEIAEHSMLVDLARNDLGKVCEFGTVKLSEEFSVHRFSHVMHIVSRVEGILSEDKDCIDALKAAFPAGTVTGAPKIKAVQLINHYEKNRRDIYAGAVGYIDFSGNLDMCIAIRTLFARGNKIFWQAGAGIVADSIPENELKEINNKAAVLVNALNYAEVIDENNGN